MNLIQHLVAFKAEVLGSYLQNKINLLKYYLGFFEGFKFSAVAIGVAEADAGIYLDEIFSKTATPSTQLAEYLREIHGKT